ncbi:hypothetical protein [Paenibacillus sp. R14(2021)]|uniref:hypothetical protein n=1 Tax=Paenibacillus sp. R14(2021) TaxID=2859228 RepID=UPI001C61413F|nr:hypothetical protein [Paenibacillus sp. R14(2021)]
MGISVTRCSLVLLLRDGFTGSRPDPSSVTVHVKGLSIKPIIKPDGLWIFTNLADEPITIVVDSLIYCRQTLEVMPSKLNKLEPVVAVSLMPGRAYPLPPSAVTLTVSTVTASGQPLKGVTGQAVLCDERGARARLSADALPGMADIETIPLLGKIAAGDAYELRSREGTVIARCVIGANGSDSRKFKLAAPLAKPAAKGSFMIPVIQASSDQIGELRFVFRPPVQGSFEVELLLSYRSQTQTTRFHLHEGRNEIAAPIVFT